MLGYHGDSMPENFDAWLNHLHADDRYRAQQDLREALLYGKESFHAMYTVLRRDHTERRFCFQAILIRRDRAERAEVVRAIGTAIDVTDVADPRQ
jgi:PAS domain-containing protein